MEFTIKVINSPNHTLFSMGRSYTFTLDSEQILQDLYDVMNEKIKEFITIPTFLTFSLLTNTRESINLNDTIKSTFSTDHILDIIDRDEYIFYLYFHTH